MCPPCHGHEGKNRGRAEGLGGGDSDVPGVVTLELAATSVALLGPVETQTLSPCEDPPSVSQQEELSLALALEARGEVHVCGRLLLGF